MDKCPEDTPQTSEEKENTDENTLTMVDVLKEEEKLEEDANAVLGDSDQNNCSYSKIVKRQALYACMTCTSADHPAGVCLACSYHCHDKHEIVELYTKRNFECDCGNSKFKDNSCILNSSKPPLNDSNSYNHNFEGLYCSCNKPYPDPDDDVKDVMLQCVICEDWYHGRHLSSNVPSEKEYGEVVCTQCLEAHSFLKSYAELIDKAKVPEEESGDKVSLESETKVENCDEVSATAGVDAVVDGCKLAKLKQSSVTSLFCPQEWRKLLCKCHTCRAMYSAQKVSFLLDEEDSVGAYEERGVERSRSEGSQYERGMKALQSMNRFQAVEALHEYNELKDELTSYLSKFASNKRTVGADDITNFFAEMKEKKKRKLNTNIPTTCR